MIDCIVFYTIAAIFQPYNGSSTNKFEIGSRYCIILCYYYRSILYLLFLTYTSILIFSLRIDPGLKYTVYCTAIKQGGQAEWDFAYNQYKTSQVASERAKLLSALSCTKVPWLLKRCGIVTGYICDLIFFLWYHHCSWGDQHSSNLWLILTYKVLYLQMYFHVTTNIYKVIYFLTL